MNIGKVTISIDLELAWGNWDNLTPLHAHHAEHSDRKIVERLLQLFDRYGIPVTWAFVAALLDNKEATGKPGCERIWYAPDVIESIRTAQVRHELGSHGGRHRYFDVLTPEEAEEDVQYAREIHKRVGTPLHSFVFPRNKVAQTDVLLRCGIRVFRGVDHAWHQRIRDRSIVLGRAANLIDKCLPIAPETVLAKGTGGLVNLPGSMLFLGRGGIRSLAAPGAMTSKLRKGMDQAAALRQTFHLWFHPSNFWHDTERQFATFEIFLSELREHITAGRLTAAPMGTYGR